MSFIFSEEVDEKVLSEAVMNSNSSILSCEVLDVFKGKQIPKDMKSVTFRLEALDRAQIKSVERLLNGLGGRIR